MIIWVQEMLGISCRPLTLGQGQDLSSKTLADGLDDGVPFDVILVVGLELCGDTSEGALESLLGRSVDHLGL